MKELIKNLFSIATSNLLGKDLLNKIILEIEEKIKKENISFDAKTGELWQQLQDFKKNMGEK